MTVTQAPTPGPLSAEDVKLLVKGDLLRRTDGTVVTLMADGLPDASGGETFIGRPDADGWIDHKATDAPPPNDLMVEYVTGSGLTSARMRVVELRWDRDFKWRPFRLAPTAPVEASGSERERLIEIVLSFPETVDLPTQRAEDLANEILADLRPQPSGETREDRLSAALIAMVLHFERVDAAPEDKAAIQAACGVWAGVKRDKALLSASPLALGGQHSGGEEMFGVSGAADEVEALACAIWAHRCPGLIMDEDDDRPHYMEAARAAFTALEDTTPARAEAQDEGAAGEQTDNAFKIASDLHAAYEQLIYGLPKYLEAENLTDEENMIREAYITLDVTAHRLAAVSDAHPSPPPAADEDRARIAVQNGVARSMAADDQWKELSPPARAVLMLNVCRHVTEALAALKSEGK